MQVRGQTSLLSLAVVIGFMIRAAVFLGVGTAPADIAAQTRNEIPISMAIPQNVSGKSSELSSCAQCQKL